MANKAAFYDLRVVSSDFLLHMKESIRKLVISKWARMVRPAMKVSYGFSASWYNPPDGPPRRPATADEACKGALQEWSKLMTEPPRKLSNHLITQYNDEFGRPRGTINFEVACNAPPDSNIRLVAQAYMGSSDSGYSIAYWSLPSEVKWLTSSSLQIGDRIIQRVDTGWKLVFHPLPPGSSGDVVSICGEKPELWDHARWMRRLKDCPHGGFVFSSGWTKWGNITSPFSKQECSRSMQHSKLSRPGPSYWKIAFLLFF